MNARRLIWASVVASSGIALVACGGASSSQTTVTQTVTATSSTEAGLPSAPEVTASPIASAAAQDTLAGYFEAFATQVPKTMLPMKTLSKPGSPAALYAEHQIATARALTAAGDSPSTLRVNVTSTEVTIEGFGSPTGEKTIDTYQKFVFDAGGLLVDWTVSGVGPLANRIRPVQGSVTSGKVTLELQTAYQNNIGGLSITFKVSNKSNAKARVFLDGYVNPDGMQARPSVSRGLLDPQPGAFMEGYVFVPDSKLGGTLLVVFGDNTEKRLVVG